MSEKSKVRIDKWLWAVRIFKTRTQATKACDEGKVKRDDENLKASKSVLVDDIIRVRVNYQNKIFKVVKLISKRVGAPIAVECYEDLTPPEETEPRYRSAFVKHAHRERGTGRPTKKERREIDRFNEEIEE